MSKIIRIQAVLDKTGLSRSAVYELCRLGQFPKQISLTSKSVGWLDSEVESWIKQRADSRADVVAQQ